MTLISLKPKNKVLSKIGAKMSLDSIGKQKPTLLKHNIEPNHNSPTINSFEEWYKLASQVRSIDLGRHLLYYIFQPVFDALSNGCVTSNNRKKTIEALDKIVAVSKEYYAAYYLKKADTAKIRQLAKEIKPVILKIDRYYYKQRNIDHNNIFPEHIGKFLASFIDHLENKKIQYPDIIIGCACGSAEIAMSLSGLLKIPLEFIRKSKRRADENPVLIEEQQQRIIKNCKGKNLLIIEDYVVTGRSMEAISQLCSKFGSKNIQGASINTCGIEVTSLSLEINEKKFQIYNYKK